MSTDKQTYLNGYNLAIAKLELIKSRFEKEEDPARAEKFLYPLSKSIEVLKKTRPE